MRKRTPRPPKDSKRVETTAAIISKDPYRLYICVKGDLPKATNKLLGAHYWQKHQNATKWKLIISNACELFLPPDLLEHVHIAAVRHSSRMLDYDGLVASLKPCIDGLKNLVIQDDSWRLTGPWKVDQRFRPKKDGPMLELWITEKAGPLDVDA